MKHLSTDRILTTHCGSLARPKDLLDLAHANFQRHFETSAVILVRA
jgi:hypothetical protein